jgi:transcriptional regulator with XRE-family HTH domain
VSKKDKEFELAFGRSIRKLREERNWSQEDLAYSASIEANQVSRVETAKHSPTLRTILALARAFGSYPHQLLDIGIALDFSIERAPTGKRRPKTKELLFKLINTDFFDTPQSVDSVARQCMKQFQIDLLRPAISAILKDLVDRKKLSRVKDTEGRRYLYKRRAK